MGTVLPISDPSIPLATLLGWNDFFLTDVADGTSITGFRTKRTKIAQVLGYVDPIWFGADPTGLSDSSAALLAAFNALSIAGGALFGAGEIRFSPGVYKFNSLVTLTLPSAFSKLRIVGSGSASTTLFWPNATGGILVDVGASGGITTGVEVSGILFLAATTNAGSAIKVRNTGLSVNPSQNISSSFRDCSFWGSDLVNNYWTTSLDIQNIGNVNFNNVTINGPGAVSGTGVNLVGLASASSLVVQFNFVNCVINSCNVGINYGTWVQGVSITNCNITDCNTAIAGASSIAGNPGQLLITTSQFGMSASGVGKAIDIQGPVDFISIVSCLFILNTGNAGTIGINLVEYGRVSLIGNQFVGPTGGIGIVMGGTLIDANAAATIQGNVFDTMTTGISLLSGSKAVTVIGNIFKAATTKISNSSADTTNIIKDNSGYNPVGASAVGSPPASGGTYTAGPSPETIYMSASTAVSAITQGGTSILPAALGANVNYTIHLGPNEAIVPTYTGTLTMKKMVH